jgi:hypothetical protein
MSRIVKVQIQADTAQATANVRELTGALSQLDTVARQSATNTMRSLGGADPVTLHPASVQHKRRLAAKAQDQTNKGAVDGKKVADDKAKADDATKKIDDTTKKAAKKTTEELEKQFTKYADDFGKMFADFFTGLISGGLNNGLKSFRDSLKSLMQGIMKQLVGIITDKIKSAISGKITSILGGGKTGAKTGSGGSTIDSAPAHSSGADTGITAIHEAIHSGVNTGLPEGAPGHPALDIPHEFTDHVTPIHTDTTTSGTSGGTSSGSNVGTTTTQTAANAIGGPGKFQTQIAGMLPGIGMSLGGMLGMGQSGASMLGQAGGLLAGGIGMAFLAPGLLTSAFGGTLAAGGAAATGLGGAMVGLLTNPFTIAVAGALIVGAIIWGINSRRRKDEKTRNQAMLDSFKTLDDLLKKVNSDQMDGAAAVDQATQVRKQYVDQMSQLKDKKTRNIALKDVSRIDDKIAQIRAASDQQTARKALDAKLVPTFADGGFVGGAGYKVLGGDGAFMSPFRGRVPGIYDRRDDFLARLTGNEVVLTPDVWMPIAPYLKQKRVPGFAGGGMVDSSGFTVSGQTSSNQAIIIEELTINLSNQFGSETAAKVLGVGVKTPEGRQAVVRSVRAHIGESGLGDGLVRDINSVNERGF